MKQVLVRGGGVFVGEVPAPGVGRRNILVRVAHSCVSVGTEVSSVRMSGLPLYRRALKQPEHARRVLEIARTDGFVRTYKRVRGQLSAGLPLGYSAAGTVVAIGDEVSGFAVGDRVACAGAGIANHAEVIDVPVNLAVHLPPGVDTRVGSTVTLGAIALQGIRRAAPTLGETIGVIGLGLLGQLTVQLLCANGCRVIGADLDEERCEFARGLGADDVVAGDGLAERARRLTAGLGLDAVIVTASTPSDDVVHEAFQSCRKKGRVVVVGDVGLGLRRPDLYEKELDLLISTSYGPGRYDSVYEEEGQDYPVGYVRWTENRNMEAYLDFVGAGVVRLDPLPSKTYPISAAAEAYESLKSASDKPLLVFLEYPEREEAFARSSPLSVRTVAARPDRIRVALIGAGSFAQGSHVPNLLRLRDAFEIRAVASRTGSNAIAVAERVGARYATTEAEAVLADEEVDLVLVATRHDLHGPLVVAALRAGKHVFVEKPLALSETELVEIEQVFAEGSDRLLMTGFNRRFSPAVERMRELVSHRAGPLVLDYVMNAGALPPDHWVHGPEGGGRNIGEACHIYDLFGAVVREAPGEVRALAIDPRDRTARSNENFVAIVRYTDGSLCTLTYTSLGHRDYPKERMEVFYDGSVVALDDYRSLAVSGQRGGWRSRTQEKGHREELDALAGALRQGGPWPIPLAEQLWATRISLAVESELSQPR